MPPLHIGIDLDNTIVDYDHVFAHVAEQLGLLPAGSGLTSKACVKNHLRKHGDGAAWMRVQGQVYGRFIGLATPYPGFDMFLSAVRTHGVHVSIVSHKTQYGHFDPDRVDLWRAALTWLDRRGFLTVEGGGIDPAEVYFEPTRDAKLDRIASLGCNIFIDDLPELLLGPAFPALVERLWFTGGRSEPDIGALPALRSWADVLDTVLARM
jgi:hypothetical protein